MMRLFGVALIESTELRVNNFASALMIGVFGTLSRITVSMVISRK